MVSTVFQDRKLPAIPAAWLNDVNTFTYSTGATKTSLAASGGAGLVGFEQDIVGGVLRTLENKGQDTISLFDVLPVAQQADMRARTSSYDIQPIFQALIDSISASGIPRTIVGPAAQFVCGSTITLKKYVSLVGENKNFELVFNNAAEDGLVIGGDTSETLRSVRDIAISGIVRDAFVCANVPTSNLGGIRLDVSGISIRAGTTATNGFTFANVYGSSFRDLQSGGTISNACFRFLATVNGVSFDNLYTGGGAGHLYCYYFDCDERPAGDATLPSGHGVMFNSPCAQGGKYGFYIAHARSLVINNPYTENVANPVVLGIAGGAVTVRGVVFNGGSFGGPILSNPYYAQRGPIWRFINARGITINSPEMFQSASAQLLSVTGGGGSSGSGYVLINRDGTPAAYILEYCGKNYATPPTVTAPAPLSGTADTLTATVAAGRITSITISVPGVAPIYATTTGYPVIALYGQRCNKIQFNAPYTGIAGDGASFHAFIGRDSTAVSTNGIDVDSDTCVDGNTITTRKTEGFAHLHSHSFFDSTGANAAFVTAPPLISAP